MKKKEWNHKKPFWEGCIVGLLVGCFICLKIEYDDLGLSNITELSFHQVLELFGNLTDSRFIIFVLPVSIIAGAIINMLRDGISYEIRQIFSKD